MKIKFNSILVAFVLITMISLTSMKPLHIDKFVVDNQNSSVQWKGEKLTGTHTGTISIVKGVLEHNHGKFTGNFTMDMNSITVTDLSGSSKEKLEKHLKSDDFFGADSFPTANFEITSLTPLAGASEGKSNFMVNGKLTIRGITNEIQFPAMVRFEGSEMTAKGELKVDRSKYNVKHRSKSFFEDIGDKIIYDEFELQLDIKASK